MGTERDIAEHKGLEEDICSRISGLDLRNSADIIWAYKNIPQIYEESRTGFCMMTRMMVEHKPSDFNASSIVLEEVGSLLKSCFGNDNDDEEMRFVMSKCGVEVRRHCGGVSMSCVDCFYRLILPFSRICTKQVVDIVAFLFTRTTTAEFDELFEIFSNKKDFLAELHLLKVRLMRERRARYKCEWCRDRGCGALEESIRNMKIAAFEGEHSVERSAKGDEDGVCESDGDQVKMDFYSMEESSKDRRTRGVDGYIGEGLDHSQDKPFYMDGAESGDGGGSSGAEVSCGGDKGSVEDSRCKDLDEGLFRKPGPCLCESSPEDMCVCGGHDPLQEKHSLSEAKRCLLDLETMSPKFFLENTALYLSMSFDEELFLLFRKYMATGYKTVCASNIFKLKEVGMERMEDMVKEVREMKGEILKADGLIVTATTLGLYVDWCVGTFNSISIASIGDYASISKLYIRFLQAFQHRNMLGILQGIFTCKIERVMNIAGAHIVVDLKEIVEIFLRLFGKTETDDSHCGGQRHREDTDGVGPSIQLSETEIERMFNDSRLFDVSSVCIEHELESIVAEIHRHHRMGFLSQIGVLEHFSSGFRSKIVHSLCTNYSTDWRYKRELLHSYRRYPHLFRESDILNTFIKDPVFIVRRTAMDIKEEQIGPVS